VLVVDDDLVIRESIEALLRDEGYHVTSAENGRVALAAMATATPDLVLLDLWMPEMNGWQLSERLRTEAPSVPVVFMTAALLAPDSPLADHPGTVLTKPFDLDRLLAAVRDALAGRPDPPSGRT